jgi:hypothetical protein
MLGLKKFHEKATELALRVDADDQILKKVWR